MAGILDTLRAPVPRDPAYNYGGLLPFRKPKAGGPAEWGLLYSDAVAGLMDAFTAPARAMQGQQVDMRDAMGMGLGLLGTNAAVSPLMKTGGPGVLNQMVFHGSPHKFDKFDMSKIGTGEGAQTFGHGLYFADNAATAQSYRASTGGFGLPDGSPVKGVATLIAAGRDELIPKAYPNITPQQMAEAKAAVANNSSLYKVDLPDPHIAKMLDWDKPISQQPENVRKALGNVVGVGDDSLMQLKGGGTMSLAGGGRLKVYDDPDFGRSYFLEDGGKSFKLSANDVRNLIGSGMEGKSIYQMLSSRFGSDAAASAKLREMGIPGIRYLDGGSRTAGQGTSNYVVFDDSIPRILSRE